MVYWSNVSFLTLLLFKEVRKIGLLHYVMLCVLQLTTNITQCGFPYIGIFLYKLEYCNAEMLERYKPTVHDIPLILSYIILYGYINNFFLMMIFLLSCPHLL